MNRKVEIVLDYPFKNTWRREGGLSYIGWPELATVEAMRNISEAGPFASLLNTTNGNFALVLKSANGIFAATDRVRSFPLFYKLTADEFILTDRIDRCETNFSRDVSAEREFLGHYCVTGDKTLLSEWRQLQAGEWLHYDTENGSLTTKRYFTFDDTGKNTIPDMDSLKQVCLGAFRKLVDHAEGRPFIVPLSGGYDSRLIIVCLKMLGVQNIFSYTYGQSDSPERIVAEQVARSMNLDWHFVEYEDSLLDIFLGDDWKQYASKNHHYTSLPHEQDYFALYALKRDGLLPMNGIVLPGYLGDYFAGSMFRDRPPVTDPGHYQDWYISNRGCKFIVNAVRLYEHFGLDWRLPFADRSVLEAWFDISWRVRTYDNVYNDFVCQVFFEPLGIDFRKQDHIYQPRWFRYGLRSILPGSWLSSIQAARSYQPAQDINNTRHLLARLGQEDPQKLKNMKIVFNAAHARFFLNGLAKKSVN